MSRRVVQCRWCHRDIQLVVVIPTRLLAGTTRKRVPLDLDLSHAGDLPPSHALSAGRTTCHPITPDRPVEPHETPAITHFATCPVLRASRPAATAGQEGARSA